VRHPAMLSSQTERRLHAYTLAAAGCGIGLLASAQPSEGQIIYTPADVTVRGLRKDAYDLDLNGDGIADFKLTGGIDGATFDVHALKGNEVMGFFSFGSSACYASALEPGRVIGSKPLKWCTNEPVDEMVPGMWGDARGRYLGFKLRADNQIYFGWARLDVSVGGSYITGHLTGYAYQSTPNQPIKAGQISDREDSEPQNAQAGSLGALALGSLSPHN
jgi:hypothetical protein